jgi:transcriptional regulator with XRE-family HTH domain
VVVSIGAWPLLGVVLVFGLMLVLVVGLLVGLVVAHVSPSMRRRRSRAAPAARLGSSCAVGWPSSMPAVRRHEPCDTWGCVDKCYCRNGKLEPVNDETVLKAVGARLRALRQQNGATLAELSITTGISISTLSRLESGQRRPTLELLLPLARAHAVPLDELVGAPSATDPRVQPQPLQRNGMTMWPLTRRPGGLQAYRALIPPSSSNGPREQQSHEGYEWMYVLSGRLRLLLGEHDLLLSPGEVVEFDTHVPHWFGNDDNVAVEVLMLFGPQGERMHVRARPQTRQSQHRTGPDKPRP